MGGGRQQAGRTEPFAGGAEILGTTQLEVAAGGQLQWLPAGEIGEGVQLPGGDGPAGQPNPDQVTVGGPVRA
ncbi:hypothetical protein GCM10027289_04520 [Tsukamurella serpentis]